MNLILLFYYYKTFCRWAISGERVTNQVPFREGYHSAEDKIKENIDGKIRKMKNKVDKTKEKVDDILWDIYINSPFL